jgi:hypothetical protein
VGRKLARCRGVRYEPLRPRSAITLLQLFLQDESEEAAGHVTAVRSVSKCNWRRPAALVSARETVNLCGFFPPEGPQRINVLAATFEGPALATSANAALSARVAQNTPDQPIAAPLVIAR